MRRPGESLLAVLLVLGIWLVVTGIVDLVRAVANARDRGFRLLAAAVDLVLGGLILALPDVSLKTLALLIGIAFIVRGVLSVVRGIALRRAVPGMIEDHLDEYRALRSSLEERILAIATSVDGRRFTLQAPLQGLELPPGGYAILEQRRHEAPRAGAVAAARAGRRGRGGVGGDRRRADGAQPAGDPGGERRGRDPVRRRRALPRRHDPRRDARTRSPPGWARAPAGARSSRSASCGCRRAYRSRSTPAASTATRSSAASPAPARPTRSASCSSSCCCRRACRS